MQTYSTNILCWLKISEYLKDQKILIFFTSKTRFHFILFLRHADGCSEHCKYPMNTSKPLKTSSVPIYDYIILYAILKLTLIPCIPYNLYHVTSLTHSSSLFLFVRGEGSRLALWSGTTSQNLSRWNRVQGVLDRTQLWHH